MAPSYIRRYQDQDWKAVRDIFSKGLLGNVPSDFWPLLKKPRSSLILLGVPIVLVLGSGSLLLSLLSFFVIFTGQLLTFRKFVLQYIEHALQTDLLDIQKSYLSARGSNLWVAESEHQVVGIVAARPAERPKRGGKYLELLRLSVKREHRGQGLARTLVQTVLQFASDHGYDGVILETSNSNHPAQRLYESLGFHKSHESWYYLNWWTAALAIWHYQCDFSSQS
ncbi:N-acetyltransferase 8F1-like [Macrotis lagotis]|uniref:N-acetyltransferase 8F1-like n=1 Tax=Macrotis lagotis TaxID=92651 RepID=UPI003D69668E